MKNRLLALASLFALGSLANAQDVNDAYEKAAKQAAAKAAPWIAKIETSGGREVVGPKGGGGGGGIRKGSGPTSGLVVDKGGYVITSSFNFANNPTDIFVTVPGKERKVAKVVAKDTSRMLTLLKIDAADLPMPVPFPKKELLVGQTSLALGRGNDLETSKSPSMSTGIVSALGRIWGKAIQTDAKVSPVNYGGPLVSLDGRVMGVLVPLSPQGDGDTAGVEWYDSGIGFAIPIEDVLAVFPRLKLGKDIGRGMLGFTPKQPDEHYNVPVVIGTVAPQSAAEKIKLEIGDKITKVDGKTIENFSELMHVLGPKYEGDTIDLVIERKGEEMTFDKISLGGAAPSVSLAFLGILPMRDDPEQGIEVRYVYPNTPAEKAGLKAGDRILNFGPAAAKVLLPVAGRGQLATAVRQLPPGVEIKIEIKRGEGGKTETLKFNLIPLSEELPVTLPMPSSKGKALDPKKGAVVAKKELKKDDEKEEPKKEEPKKEEPKKEEPKKEDKKDDEKKEKEEDKTPKGLLVDQTNEATGRSYWMYVPDNYDKNKSYGVIIWFHNTGKGGKDAKDMKKIWEDYCDSANFIIIGPQSKTGNEWVATETEGVVQTINQALQPYTIDRSRVVVHGMGNGGSMALYVAFNARDLVRGCCVSGAVLNGNAKDNLPNQPLAFYIVAGNKDPLLKEIGETNEKLKAKKFPTIYKELANFGKEYLDQPTLQEICLWLDSLDRI
jgi:S1-C subfamily serine protease/predicted esterase